MPRDPEHGVLFDGRGAALRYWPVPPPTIQTERLILRPHTFADFDECAAMWGDAAVTRYIGARPATPEEVWARILRYAGLWSLLGYGYWAARERGTGRFVGDVGFADFHRDITPSLDGAMEMGWVLAPWAHGRGFATEAVTAALDWSDARSVSTSQPRVVCIISPENTASMRVADRCGFRVSVQTSYKEQATIVFERFAEPAG